MRIFRFAALAAVAGLLVLAAPAFAQKPKLKIEEARIGVPPGRFVSEKDSSTSRSANIVKKNVWAPIYIRLQMLNEYDGKAKLRIESADADELRTTMVVPLNTTFGDRLKGTYIESTELGIVPNVRIGDRDGKVTLTVITDPTDGSRPKDLSDPYKLPYLQFSNVSSYVVLSLGTRLPGFELPRDNTVSTTGSNQGGLRNGRVLTSTFTNVREMPDQWFAYDGVDLVVLATGTAPAEFLDELFDDDKSRPFADRRDALYEWVRRGGKLIISAGSNSSKLSQYEKLREILPAQFNRDQPSRGVKALDLEWKTTSGNAVASLQPRTETFPMARLTANPARPPRYLIPDEKSVSDAVRPAAVVQAPLGLGRVTLVAFDLDQSPFIDSPNKAAFWDWLIREGGSQKAALAATTTNNYNYGYGSTNDTEDEYATALRTHVDTFDGVPVISFGWVALFIVLYTLLIGPVEYLILKKVFGRLELTWITFPIIVVTVSAAAYFTAYAIKGNDLKVNKIDVVDIDLQGGRTYGHSWFTVFSPRIDSYTIGVEPREGWTVKSPTTPPASQVGWMAGGRGGGGGGIVTRGYAYHTDTNARTQADGLEKVPIQVWSTKAFIGNWVGYNDKVTPIVDADLYHPQGNPSDLAGSFVNNLPVRTLQNPVLVYAGTIYQLPTLTPGQKVNVNLLPKVPGWFDGNASLSGIGPVQTNYNYTPNSRNNATVQTVSTLSFWGGLFHEKASGRSTTTALQNASLRNLDMSWRLTDDNRHEAILVAKVDSTSGAAEDLMGAADGPSATKLWLKNLPGDPAGRQPVPGTLRQETYVRVYIPVQAKPKAAK